MKVTDKDFYLDDNLIANLDFCIRRQKKGWDNLLIIDGDEGSGKSTLAKAIGYYLAQQTGTEFTVDNVFFKLEEMMEYAANNEKKVILWDEAAMEALAKDWMGNLQKKLIKILMMARKKGHMWIFVIPDFSQLSHYIAVRRSLGLIHVYSQDNLSRGTFVFMNKPKKNSAYNLMKKTKMAHYYKFDFAGKFTEGSKYVIDDEAYEEKKDEAILSLFQDREAGETKSRSIIYAIGGLDRYSTKELADHFEVTERTIQNYKKRWKEAQNPRNTAI